MRHLVPLSEARRAAFLAALRETGIFVVAAQIASPHSEAGAVSTFRNAMAREPEFRAQVQEALEEAAGVIELEVHRRAFEGAVESRSDGKGGTWYSTRLSDACLLALAKARVPAFRDKVQVDATVAGTVKVLHAPIDPTRLTDEELGRMVEILDRLEGAAPAALPQDAPMDADFELHEEDPDAA